MNSLISQIRLLQESPINEIVEQRLREFSSFSYKEEKEWFSELCFCILAANSKQKTAETIQSILGPEKLLTLSQKELSGIIRQNKHRFHNNKAKYIIEARKYKNIKSLIQNKPETEARNWLVQNIKGIGMKEASHFLRNTGSQNLAILDRHILRTLHENKIIDYIPKSVSINNYLLIESRFIDLAKKLNIPPAKLDLFLWFMKTREVAK